VAVRNPAVQTVLISTAVALALGVVVAILPNRPRLHEGPPPIGDPYEELYSDRGGEVVAGPLGKRPSDAGGEARMNGEQSASLDRDTGRARARSTARLALRDARERGR
jgi:hypothetical protein